MTLAATPCIHCGELSGAAMLAQIKITTLQTDITELTALVKSLSDGRLTLQIVAAELGEALRESTNELKGWYTPGEKSAGGLSTAELQVIDNEDTFTQTISRLAESNEDEHEV